MFEFEIRKGQDDSLVDSLGFHEIKHANRCMTRKQLLKLMRVGQLVIIGAHDVTDNYVIVNYYPVSV